MRAGSPTDTDEDEEGRAGSRAGRSIRARGLAGKAELDRGRRPRPRLEGHPGQAAGTMDQHMKSIGIAVLLLSAASSTRAADPPRRLPDDLFSATEEVAKQRSQERLQKIQQLTFDRRPSAVLKAWATPEEGPKSKTEKKAGTTETTAAPSEMIRESVSVASPAPATSMAMRAVTIRRATATGVMIATRAVPATSGTVGVALPPEVVAATGGEGAVVTSVEEAKAEEGAAAEKKDEPAVTTYRAEDFDEELKKFQRKVTLGDWAGVKEQLGGLVKDEREALYKRLVQALPDGGQDPNNQMMMMQAQMPVPQQFMERGTFSNGDVIALADMSPVELDDDLIQSLGRILSLSLEEGNSVGDFAERAEAESKEGGTKLDRRRAAKLLFAAGREIEAGKFLPTIEEAEKADDREALNLLSRHYVAQYQKDPKAGHLERAWSVTQAVLAAGEVPEKAKAEALQRAVELAPKVDESLGRAWLVESFEKRPERGMEILAAIGEDTTRGIQARPMDTEGRKKLLELQKQAVEALLKAAPERAPAWADRLALLAQAWMKEADYSRQFDMSTSRGPRMQRDIYGNIFYSSSPGDPNMNQMMMMQNNGMPQAIPVGDVLDQKPGEEWAAKLPASLSPRFQTLTAQLLLKVGEEAEAFPYIEKLSATNVDQAKDLAEEFVRVWTRNHDPNAAKDYTNPYIYMYGFEQRAESIPLTRAKQERNLKELADWVGRLKKLPLGEMEERLLARAFTSCHSVAEVYDLGAIESVFGPVGDLEPETLAELVQQMRANLVGVWRAPAVQDQAKTKRREKDIRAEVMRGYDVARSVLEGALAKHPENWKLALAKASVMHDENDYKHEAELSTDFVPARKAAMEEFAKAAELYAKALPEIDEEERTAEVYEVWYYASLGATDLGQVKAEHVADRSQPPLIKAAIDGLPGDAAEKHRTMFANDLFIRMSNANPSVKFAYVEGGFQIVGDHPRAQEAKKIYDYYKDLNGEITLRTRVDGPDRVGHGEPFGLFVDIRHTREIEREAGGFGKYLQNQNQGGMFYYNYGRPLENYRDKFEEAAREALKEQFEVLSVTFQAEDVNSKATAEYGWRVTPYAYLLLKARGPQVDKVPPLRLDFDFLDTSGYVILPVESPSLPVDASPEKAPSRPVEKLQVTQTLDERQAEQGKLILEVKATGRGLVPGLDELLEVKSPGVEVAGVEDQGLSVSRFDPESDETAVVSERSWLVNLKAVGEPGQGPKEFRFSQPKPEGAEVVYQRYVDADLQAVPAEVALEGAYGEPSYKAWVPWAVGAPVGLALLGLAWWRWRPRGVVEKVETFRVPDPLTPFSVLGLLRDIEHRDGLNDRQRGELAGAIAGLESHYFAGSNGGEPDLRSIAESWVSRARR